MNKYYNQFLQLGSEGDDVKRWQEYLNSYGAELDVDGIFGEETQRWTKDIQSSNGLTADGIVGKDTWEFAGFSPAFSNRPSIGAIGGLINSGADWIGNATEPDISLPTDTKDKETPKQDTETPKQNAVSAPKRPTFNTSPTARPMVDTTLWDDTDKGQMAHGAYEDAKGDLYKYEGYQYDEYAESDAVKNAADALSKHSANKPVRYQSKWNQQLNGLMDQIMNREKFSYNMNEDALYQQYKDKYIEQGKLAMADTMGQASAMTGGYGSSWAQSVGAQAYHDQLGNLNDIVPELYQMALDRYNMEGQELLNQYGLVADREDLDYARYRDTVADWMTNRDYLTDRYESERGFDYGKHLDTEDMEYKLSQDEYSRLLDSLGMARDDYYDGASMHYAGQDRLNSESRKEYEAKEAERQYGNSLLQQDYQNEWAEKEWQRDEERYDQEWERNEERYQDGLGSGSKDNGDYTVKFNSDGSLDLSSIPGIHTDDASWFDENGKFKTATLTGSNGDATDPQNVYRLNGKNITVKEGFSPYTNSRNDDVEYGVLSNGYQPDNIGNVKLKPSELVESDWINGVQQTVWELPDGSLWIWDDTQNKYLEYQ